MTKTKKVSKKATTKVEMSLSKDPVSTKWPIKKFLNKFWIYNLFITIGFAMLILSCVCTSAFKNDTTKIVSNIIASCLVMTAGVAGHVTYSLLLYFKGEKPLDKKFAKLCMCLAWIPLVGIVFAAMWKRGEKNAIYAQRVRENPEFKKPKLQLPNSVSIIFAAMIAVVFVIWILYLSGVIKTNDATVIPGILDIFLNPLRGFAGYDHKVIETVGGVTRTVTKHVNGTGGIIIFLLLFNGTMTLVNDTHAIEAGIGSLLKKMHGKEIILIPILMFILAICGSTFNMCEQLLPLFMVVIPIFFAAGYDRMTGFLVVFMSAGVGVMGSTVNPVLIGTAISSVPSEYIGTTSIMTGISWRLIVAVVLIVVSIVCTMLYARKVKINPKRSCVYMQQDEFAKQYNFDKDALPPMTRKRMWTLIVFALAFLMLIIGFIDWKQIAGFNGFEQGTKWLSQYFPFLTSIGAIGSWGMIEAGMLFFIASLVIGAINWKGAGHWFSTFYTGCREFIGVAFIIAVAKGLAITLTDSGLNGIIADGLGSVLKSMGAVGAMFMIFIVISLLTVFIPSSSGLSSAMFPVIGTTIGKLGTATISMSGAVTTFASAMGWVNLFTPTGMVLPFLEVSKMDMTDFVKAAWKQILILLVVGLGLLAVGTVLPAGMF